MSNRSGARWKRLAFLALAPIAVVGLPVYLFTRTNHVNATATCQNVEHFRSNLGLVNVPLYGLGKVLVLDTDTKAASGLMTLPVSDADLEKGPKQDLTEKIDTKLAVTFEVAVPESVRTKATAALASATQITLKNAQRVELKSPLQLANGNEELRTQLNIFKADRAKKVVLVAAVKYADNFDLHLGNDAEGKADANILKYGQYELAVSYQCKSLLSVTAKAAGVFFSFTALKLDATGAITLDDVPADVDDYDLSQTFAPP